MCGISGIVLHPQKTNKSISKCLEKMLKAIHHRGPDDWGMSFFGEMENPFHQTGSNKVRYTADSGYSLALGHQRLSIIDLSELGRQPMKDNSGNYEIIFNGEIYNYKEIREQLEDKYSFHSQSDTEVLLAAYSLYGKDMLNLLDGMFSFVIWDSLKKELFCARDHVSIKPFYYMETDDGFFFASEPKAIVAGIMQSPQINHTIASNFILTGICDYNENTFFQDINQLKGGYYLIYDVVNTEIKSIKKYWEPDRKIREIDNPQKAFLNVFTDTVFKQLRSDVPLGSSLSGGIDSGSIVTIAGELLRQDPFNYTAITFSEPGFEGDESKQAQKIAQNAGMKWQLVSTQNENVAGDIEKMMINMGEPFSTLSMYAQYKVMNAANAHGIKVMLDGQGGDEVFLGYPRVAQLIVKEYLQKGNIIKAIQELKGLRTNASQKYINILAGNIIYNSPSIYMSRAIEKSREYLHKDFLMNYDKTFAANYYAPKSIIEKQYHELTKYCLPRLLKYADRNSMHFGVESRVPFLGRNVVEFGLTLPLQYRVNNGWTKSIIRHSMQGKMPDEVLWDNVKKGFDIPQQHWVKILEKKLINWIEESDTADLFKKDIIIRHIKDPHLAGNPGLWRIISTICWIRLLNVKV